MLRVGLTGGLGSGKSTVAAALRALGAQVIEADELGRALMEPGQPVFAEIVRVFGAEVVASDGRLDRARLAKMAFEDGRLSELNAIVHPAVIAVQQRWMDEVFARDPRAVAVVESALIFEVERDARARGEQKGVPAGPPGDTSSPPGLLADWRNRFDRIIVLTAPDEVKIARYASRMGGSAEQRETAERDARIRLARQIPDAEKAARADFVLENTGDLAALRTQVEALWQGLCAESNKSVSRGSLE
jgi:dephospho-CoA kinase